MVIGGDDAEDGTTDAIVRARNIISANNTGIALNGSPNARIQGNFIGTNAAGTAALGNTGFGIQVDGAASANTQIGGTSAGAGNLVSGNTATGIWVNVTSAGTRVEGNLVGTDLTGMIDLGNGMDGIFANSVGLVIGGTTAATRNLISGNTGDGIEVLADGVIIQGNLIGTQINGTAALPNNGFGIQFTTGTDNATVGGIGVGAANVIANNGLDGVFVSSGTGNVIRGNSIHSNTGLGIDLQGGTGETLAGVTPNDLNDADTGPNNRQNFPVITSVISVDGTTTVQGTLNSLANTTFDLDFYTNVVGDASLHGEGQTYVGSTTVTTTGNDATFLFAFPTVAGQNVVSATATGPGGNTSEFGMFFTAQTPVVLDFGDAPDTYLTTLAAGLNGGARHTSTGVLLGSQRDTEADASTPLNGTGDDVTGTPDDEDGVTALGMSFMLLAGAMGSGNAHHQRRPGERPALRLDRLQSQRKFRRPRRESLRRQHHAARRQPDDQSLPCRPGPRPATRSPASASARRRD